MEPPVPLSLAVDGWPEHVVKPRVKLMTELFSGDFWWAWALVLGGLLFLPVRRLIWMMSANRAARRAGPVSEEELARLKRRAGVTAFLLCYIFAVLYAYAILRTP